MTPSSSGLGLPEDMARVFVSQRSKLDSNWLHKLFLNWQLKRLVLVMFRWPTDFAPDCTWTWVRLITMETHRRLTASRYSGEAFVRAGKWWRIPMPAFGCEVSSWPIFVRNSIRGLFHGNSTLQRMYILVFVTFAKRSRIVILSQVYKYVL